jgi:Co/Zn/Cd efflux system component
VQQHEVHRWEHDHVYLTDAHHRGERNTRRVIALTAVMMVVEIVAGSVFNSMALLADGWHMASHASALGITAFAYAYARRHFAPLQISFDEAIAVAVVGLAVNLVSAYLLNQPHADGERSGAAHAHGHTHDHNLRAAYLHVLADALTSLFAIFALTTGKLLGWVWMDPVMGIVGSIIIGRWSIGLLRQTSRVLLDGDVEAEFAASIRSSIERDSDDSVADLHLWHIGPSDMAAIISVVTHDPRPPDHYKGRLPASARLSHVTVEVNRCPGVGCSRG